MRADISQQVPEDTHSDERSRYWSRPHSSRIYDYLIDGTESYELDRKAACAVYQAAEWIKTGAYINRDFGRLSTCLSLDRGIRQFLDLGCGLPAPLNVKYGAPDLHRTVAKVQRGCPVVYVDSDRVVFGWAKTVLDEGPPDKVTPVHADLLDMHRLLTSSDVAAAFDLSQPIAVSLNDTLPWNGDDKAVHDAMSVLRHWMPVGSTLSITHATSHWQPQAVSNAVAVYDELGIVWRPRTGDEIGAFFGDFVHYAPGLTATGKWHDKGRFTQHPPKHSGALAGIAVKESDSARLRPAAP